jgi:hypothetical protein
LAIRASPQLVTASSPTDTGGSFALPPGNTAGTSADLHPEDPHDRNRRLARRWRRHRRSPQRAAPAAPGAPRAGARLSVTAAEQRSHNLPEQDEVTRLLWAVEETIHDSWPRTYYTQFPQWCAEEEKLLHDLGGFASACSICHADRSAVGAVHQPQDAA